MSGVLHLGVLSVFGDAIDFIFHQQEARTGQTMVGGPDQVFHLTGQHLKVTFLALGLAVVIALPIGVALGHFRRGEAVAISVGNAGRAVPELALIAFVAAFIGVGLLNVTFALAILGIPPILTNSYVGVSQVDRNAVEAARGMGMRGAAGGRPGRAAARRTDDHGRRPHRGDQHHRHRGPRLARGPEHARRPDPRPQRLRRRGRGRRARS